jgi:uncharacterized protein YeaO (DUF488 family)
MSVTKKRAYDPPARTDGKRILIDRLCVEGQGPHRPLLKDVAPSTELRKWFGHDPEKWSEAILDRVR